MNIYKQMLVNIMCIKYSLIQGYSYCKGNILTYDKTIYYRCYL